MANIVAPPKMIVKDRKPTSEDIALFGLKTGDKWFHKSAGKGYFITGRLSSNWLTVAVIDTA